MCTARALRQTSADLLLAIFLCVFFCAFYANNFSSYCAMWFYNSFSSFSLTPHSRRLRLAFLFLPSIHSSQLGIEFINFKLILLTGWVKANMLNYRSGIERERKWESLLLSHFRPHSTPELESDEIHSPIQSNLIKTIVLVNFLSLRRRQSSSDVNRFERNRGRGREGVKEEAQR